METPSATPSSNSKHRDMLILELISSVLRQMDKSCLRSLLDYYSTVGHGTCSQTSAKSESCEKVEFFLVDLLASLGTSHAVSLIRDLVSKYPLRLTLSMPFLGLVQPPHPAMIAEIKVGFFSRFLSGILNLNLKIDFFLFLNKWKINLSSHSFYNLLVWLSL